MVNARAVPRRGLCQVLGAIVTLGLLASCSSGRIDLGGGVSHSAASQFVPESLSRVAAVSRVVVLADVIEPVRNLPVPDSAPLSEGGPPIPTFFDYETARVRVVSVLAQQAGAEAFGVTAGSVQNVGVATDLRTARADDGVTTADYDNPPAGATLPGVGMPVVLFLGAPGPMPDGMSGLFVFAALRPTDSSPDLLAPSAAPVIAGVSGPLRGQLAPVGWLASVPATVGSEVGPLPAVAG